MGRIGGTGLMAAVVLAFMACGECFARIGPSFDLEYCAWHASEIIVVTQGAKSDGKLTVLKTWKGSLKNDEIVTIPQLAGYAPSISEDFEKTPTKIVAGQRMVLFLVRATKGPEASSRPGSADAKPKIVWAGASNWKIMNVPVSMVWIEQGRVYNFEQVRNPGDTLLISRRQTEEQFKKDVDAVLADQAKLEKTLAIKDASERAKALKPLAAGNYTEMRRGALDGIAGCGQQALPVLHEMLADNAYDQYSVVDTLVKVAGKDAAGEVITILKQDLEYWRKLGPVLKVGWWDAFDLKDRLLYQNRYGRLSPCLYCVKLLQAKGAGPLVKDLRDFWRSLPQLEDKRGLNQISQECDSVLKALEQPDVH